MEIILSAIGLGSFASILGLVYFVLTLKNQVKEFKQKTEEVYDLLFGPGLYVEYRFKDGKTQFYSIDEIREKLAGKEDEALVLAKRVAQNNLRIWLNQGKCTWENRDDKRILVCPEGDNPHAKK